MDARGHLLGRLASVVAKQILSGQHVTIVRCEEILISGGLTRQRMKYERFLAKAHNSNKFRCGPWHYRRGDGRAVRGTDSAGTRSARGAWEPAPRRARGAPSEPATALRAPAGPPPA